MTPVRISLEHIGPLAQPGREPRIALALPSGSDVHSLLLVAGYADHELERLNVLVNGRHADLLTPPSDGDEVVLTLLAGGG